MVETANTKKRMIATLGAILVGSANQPMALSQKKIITLAQDHLAIKSINCKKYVNLISSPKKKASRTVALLTVISVVVVLRDRTVG